ncbi:hypothetical protein EB796_022046 [Bugula neritina]|uniref:Uncharacterized protein n=1 Tax=Bugula neritina TaxID=10212 RepID=A0A7J7J1B8_BUGNE|nr:hypothetical protein EB796_022046 [Bugula neritina]
MDWEKKFTTIVNETEANLDRVRRRLEAARKNTGDMEPETLSAPVTSRHSTVYSLPTSAKHSVMASDKSVGPPIWATILEEKLSQQHKTIESLTKTVLFLQTEKEKQKSVIDHLQGDIKLLQGRLEEKGANVDTENKLSIWQQETQQQINNLRQQIIRQQQSDTLQTASRHSVDELVSKVIDAKQVCHDEVEGARRDMDYYKTRMTRLEKKMNSLSDNFSDLSRKHNELSSDLASVEGRTKHDYRELSHTLSQKIADLMAARNEASSMKDVFPKKSDYRQRLLSSPPVPVGAERTSVLRQEPTAWRELLSHSLSRVSIASSDSTLSSGYLARKQSKDSEDDIPDRIHLTGGLADSSSSEESLLDVSHSLISTPSSSPTSLSIKDL